MHAPIEQKNYEEKDQFYEEIETIYNRCPANDNIGEFNAKIGNEEGYWGQMGRHSLHDTQSHMDLT